MPSDLTPARLAERFQRFAYLECDSSPLYRALCRGIAQDSALLALAAHCAPGQPAPNLLLAAVHYLLLKGERHPLAGHYPSLAGAASGPLARDHAFPHFRAFCIEQRDSLARLISARQVQTNEVRRCALLLPAFLAAARALVGAGRAAMPLHLVEIGASAGLNLLWDRYSYDFGEGQRYGAPNAPLHLTTRLRGPLVPPLDEPWPTVAGRIGLDLNPIDVRDDDSVLWLQALVWPENAARAARLRQAVHAARLSPPPMLSGDALGLLPGVLAAVLPHAALCVYHSFTLNQFSPEQRADLADLLARHAAGGAPVFWVSLEWLGGPQPLLSLASFTNGAKVDKILASCHAHGTWLEWRLDERTRVHT